MGEKLPTITTQFGRIIDKLNTITTDLARDPDDQLLIEEREKEKMTLMKLNDQEETILK